jgi:hypothetical protein
MIMSKTATAAAAPWYGDKVDATMIGFWTFAPGAPAHMVLVDYSRRKQ